MVWLSVAFFACGGSSTRSVSDGEGGVSQVGGIGGTGGFGGTGTGGRGGTGAQPTGGFSGTDVDGGTGGLGGSAGSAGTAGASGAGPSMNRVQISTNGYLIYYDDISLASEIPCTRQTTLVKANGEAWIDERPPCGEPYFIDGVYEENELDPSCNGCGVLTCAPFPRYHSFDTIDYVQIGTRPDPNDGAGGEPGGAGAPNEIPDIRSSIFRGPLTLTIRYYADGRCSTPIQSQPPVTFEVATDR